MSTPSPTQGVRERKKDRWEALQNFLESNDPDLEFEGLGSTKQLKILDYSLETMQNQKDLICHIQAEQDNQLLANEDWKQQTARALRKSTSQLRKANAALRWRARVAYGVAGCMGFLLLISVISASKGLVWISGCRG
ncbi:hypothetical protein V5O48_005437 [Marasmius crinis-equi]|uniref:Uncharacterized protein n=1 Tax=Marasmius crinis-equi TaxID=585013 RepID=A0ABR3FMC6_9AGAR